MYHHKTYTIESVTSGHPDKICDQISDAILDACLAQDTKSRVAVETFGSHGLLILGGEITTRAQVDYEQTVRDVYKNIGYIDSLEVRVHIAEQSPDIAQGVDTGGAGDQGIMYGFATNETKEFLPDALVKVHLLARGLEDLRRNNHLFSWLKPDGKTQITVSDEAITTVLISTQHDADIEQEKIRTLLARHLIEPVVGSERNVSILINPTGTFVQGGFEADAGLTGRKIMVDTYGGLAPHGGGAFSGKDPSKVDRSAAYMTRFAAKNIVANGYAKKCLVSVAYAIGKAEPLMVSAINERGETLPQSILQKFDFRPQAIIEQLDLLKPIYQKTAAYGHFGKNALPWEKITTL